MAVTDSGSDLFASVERALGRQYRLERELGRGGMGIVYLARDLTLDRRVAVKVIHPELVVNRGLAGRFLAEARLIARIRHPNIVAVHAAGEAEGHLFYVMDYLSGETLRQRLQREGRLPVEAAVAIAGDIALAVDAAATAGVVHRDLKPENILLEGDPQHPRALLTDFGIARLVEGGEGHTGPNAVMGTPAYMSPEQAAGDAVDSRSDLYALGVVAYEMLLGEPPFSGPARVVVSRQLVDPPTPLASRRAGIPAAVEAAVMRALEKVPESRWQTGEQFRRHLLGEPTPPAPAVAHPRRRRLVLALVAVAAVALGALGVSLWDRGRPPAGVNPRLSLLVLPFDNLRDDAALAWLRDGSVNMLALAMAQWRDLAVVDQDRVHDLLARQAVQEDEPIGLSLARRLAREAGAWTVVLGDYAMAGDSLRLTARAYDVGTGSRLDVVEVSGPVADDVRPLFDSLAARLLDLSGAPAGGRASLASVTTGSLEAYRAYLQGQEHLNHWALVPAEAEFRRAVRLDSSFSLAYFRLSLARGWMTGAADTAGRNAILNAARFAERLPPREREMIDAYRSLVDGDYGRSQRLYDGLLARDSTDADAWYGLGDAVFHDSVAGSSARGMTRSLRAFKRALELDPSYALAYEHITSLLTNATRWNSAFFLVGPDSLVDAYAGGRSAVDSASREAALRRARAEATQTARTWVGLQPGTARAHRALFEAYLASDNFPGASQEVAEIRRLLPRNGQELAAFLEARVRFASGDGPGAASLVRSTTASLGGRAPPLPDFGRELLQDVSAGANVLVYQGDLDGAAEVVALADEIRRAAPATGLEAPAWNEAEVWEWARLAQLYAAAGGPERELRRIWGNILEAARRAPVTEQANVAGAGAAAAVGLLLSTEPDARALAELESLTGRPAPRGVRALLALSRGDSAGARRHLADTTRMEESEKRGSLYWGFASGDPRPVEAEVHFQLGEFQAALDILRGFDEQRLARRGFDARWGLLGRVHLLRGLAHERLGQVAQAEEEFRKVIDRWRGADEPLLVFVQQAQAGLARLKGARG